MNYNFDEIINRHGTDSVKWDAVELDEGNRLSFRCSNSNNGSADEQHHGIGLENIRKRLRLLFGNDYTLSITEEEHKFDVLLIIPLLE